MMQDHEFMSRALDLAKKGLFTTGENPRVGCVLVRDGEIVGEGWHRYAGGPHAEMVALSVAGEQARGATAYVTLEPCCFKGKTGACTDALIQAGVSRVVAAMQDPNPRVSGRGEALLKRHGIAYQSHVMESESKSLNPGFLHRMLYQRPYVRLKMAASLDGRTALASGESQWITGDAARHDVHYWRARSDAVLTGRGTVLADDPRLNARVDEDRVQPLRVVLDTELDTSPDANIYVGKEPVVVICRHQVNDAKLQRFRDQGLEVVFLDHDADNIRLPDLLTWLAGRCINEVWVESGATLAGCFVAEGLVDELVIYLAPKILGSRERPMFQMPSLSALQDCTNLKIEDVRRFGDDLRLIARVLN